ncbi:MAG: Dihydrofolate reductase [Parcubacteria group bacterium GW2011_GWA2_36_10]|nr:MAG: Dihydrofolate reductase [Parcubacteria group bacterium GW2011_GWA2_36_10]
MISIIAAIDKNRALGYQNKLLVHLPEDLAHFKKITSGHPVIMGQNTYASIGRALPNRLNIVLSQDKNFTAPDCVVFNDLNKALDFAKSKDNDEIFFIGGANVYNQAIKIADKLYLTIIDAEYQADVWFPDYSNFKIIKEEEQQNAQGLKYKFLELIRQ